MSSIPDPSELRPLPARPNLEFERKAAKQLLRACRDGDGEALARVQARGIRSSSGELLLADAQLTIAREYGFSSWPKLVAYYETWEMHERSGPMRSGASARIEHYEGRARSLIAEHAQRLPNATPLLASFIPRFIGRSDEEIFAAVPTEDEARLAVARSEKHPSWEVLASSLPAAESNPNALWESPYGRAITAIKARDFVTLATIVDEHPEFLDPDYQSPSGGSLLGSAFGYARTSRGSEHFVPGSETESVVDWFAQRGVNQADAATRVLARLGMGATTEMVAELLARGADPAYVPPNGVGVLDRLLLLAWNPAAVDLIASRMRPRKAFWIAAGLGDVNTMRGYFAPQGRLTQAARADRPDFVAIGFGMPCRPDVPDRDILWEAFLVAGFNQRTAAVDLLLEKGFPIDYSPWGQNLLHVAVGNRLVEVVELLVSRGADVNLRGYHPSTTARETAEKWYRDSPDDPKVQRIYRACVSS